VGPRAQDRDRPTIRSPSSSAEAKRERISVDECGMKERRE